MKFLPYLGCLFLFNLQATPTFWENQYSSDVYTTDAQTVTTLEHHSSQNLQISSDFLKEIGRNDEARIQFKKFIQLSQNMIEIGCGSGEMLQLIKGQYTHLTVVGLDISRTGILYASENNKYPDVSYVHFDCLQNNIKESFGPFDLAICSNTLEHFKNPFALLDNILQAASLCMILVPYKQPITDGYSMEGGAGHVFTFDEHSFVDYQVLSWFVFQTNGWQYSSKGETPLQLAIIVSKR